MIISDLISLMFIRKHYTGTNEQNPFLIKRNPELDGIPQKVINEIKSEWSLRENDILWLRDYYNALLELWSK
jgi:hypothetical protein